MQSLFSDKFKDSITQRFLSNNDFFAKLFNDSGFYLTVQESMTSELYKALSRD